MIYAIAALVIETTILGLVVVLWLKSEGYKVQANKIILEYSRLIQSYDFIPNLEQDGKKIYQKAVRRLR